MRLWSARLCVILQLKEEHLGTVELLEHHEDLLQLWTFEGCCLEWLFEKLQPMLRREWRRCSCLRK